MKNLFLLLSSFLAIHYSYFHSRKKIDDNLARVVDSLKNSILRDTSKFDSRKIVVWSIGKVNSNSYSPLFIIDSKYRYKLDVVPGAAVMEFVSEFLKSERIKMINILSTQDGNAIYGVLGSNGVVVMNMKDKESINYEVGGLKRNSVIKSNF